MRRSMLMLTALSLTAFAGLGACDDGGDSDTTRTLALSFSGLEALGGGYVYEGWIMVDGAPVTSGRFTVGADGALNPATFTLDAAMADRATAFILTVEPGTGDDPAPSDTHVLAGDIASGSATLTAAHGAALGTDFASVAGEFILATPSSTTEDDEAQGIWWLVPGTAGMSAGLTLPTLPNGWAYEGWVVGADGPVSTGRFQMAAEMDSDAAGPTSGPDGTGPPFPGQDFVNPAVSLVGLIAVISVEPEPDDSAAPFALKPLVDMEIGDVAKPATQPMAANLGSIPTGTATIQ